MKKQIILPSLFFVVGLFLSLVSVSVQGTGIDDGNSFADDVRDYESLAEGKLHTH